MIIVGNLKHAVEPIRKGIYEQKVLKKNGQDNFMSLEEGVKRVRKVWRHSRALRNRLILLVDLNRDYLHFIWNLLWAINS